MCQVSRAHSSLLLYDAFDLRAAIMQIVTVDDLSQNLLVDVHVLTSTFFNVLSMLDTEELLAN